MATRNSWRKAGRSADEQFKVRLLAWRQRKRKGFGAVFAILLLPSVGLFIWGSPFMQFVAIFLAGFNSGMLTFAWDSPPNHIERWRRGAEGERHTAKVLRGLTREADWTVVHDVAGGYGNRDHIATGPSGTYLLDTKNVMGPAAVENGILTVRATDEPRDTYSLPKLARALRGASAGLSEELSRTSGERVWVQPVCVVWPALENDAVESDRVWYVSGKHVGQWLKARPAVGRSSSAVAAAVRDAVRTAADKGASYGRVQASSDRVS